MLRAFIDQYPTIDVIVNVLKSYEIGEEVSLSRADLGLTKMSPIQTNIKSEIVHEDPVILVGPNECKEDNDCNEQTILQHYRLITDNHPDYWGDLLHDVKSTLPKCTNNDRQSSRSHKAFY